MSQLYDKSSLEEDITADAAMDTNISMSSEDEDSNELHVTKIHAELLQLNKIKNIARRLSIVNVYYLQVREQSSFSKKKYWVHLGYLQKKPKRRLIVAWRWLLTAIGFATITWAAYNFIPTFDFPYNRYALIGALIGGTALSMISMVAFFYQSRYRHVFYTKNGNMPCVEMEPGNPNRKKFREFNQILQAHLDRAGKDVDPNKALARELREHRRLNEFGIISDKQYENAKGLLFKGHSQTQQKK